nr:hypothetical protein [Dermatophilus congolensis]
MPEKPKLPPTDAAPEPTGRNALPGTVHTCVPLNGFTCFTVPSAKQRTGSTGPSIRDNEEAPINSD